LVLELFLSQNNDYGLLLVAKKMALAMFVGVFKAEALVTSGLAPTELRSGSEFHRHINGTQTIHRPKAVFVSAGDYEAINCRNT
jgi:hypothetical protein